MTFESSFSPASLGRACSAAADLLSDQPLWGGMAGGQGWSEFGAAGGGGLSIMIAGPGVSLTIIRSATTSPAQLSLWAARPGMIAFRAQLSHPAWRSEAQPLWASGLAIMTGSSVDLLAHFVASLAFSRNPNRGASLEEL